ncbi:non-specific lipid transfer protein GPI-anchored 10-like [Typha angustifolia]|uniref:non-specific lipid transfer protein GPI-anchored 10-like n=1 Tax=Typha angustifolia TaxID=59011 RepID=UPI003C2FA447
MASHSTLPALLTIAITITLLLTSLPCAHLSPLSNAVSCSTSLLVLLPCMPFAQGAATSPPDQCCDNLADVLRDQPGCVCSMLNRSSLLPINHSLVVELPRLCRINLTADADACPGLSLPPSASPGAFGLAGPNVTSAAVPPVMESPPPPPRTNNLLLGLNWGGKLRVEGTSLALAIAAQMLAVGLH